ncbi:MAG: DNA phosphorothioation-associated putative methyltransferase [Shewanella sp.]|nr:DNA phosphorothioation-associated putative methyltransferase [Shewanella sp.]
MDSTKFSQLVRQVSVGKQLPEAIYIHKDAFTAVPDELTTFINAVAAALKIEASSWHLVKLFKNDFRLSLLSYPTFYTDSYPALRQSVTVDLNKLTHRVTTYQDADNPPILHRKELMILPSSDYYSLFVQLTEEGENAGLYDNARLIGFKQSWENLIAQHGYALVDGRLFRSSMVEQADEHQIDRHKTAITRHALSAPMKALAKQGYLQGDYSVFDYGCGKGDDMHELLAHGIDVLGWDPNFYPDGDKTNADIVNLGFVLNVIEDKHERLEALLGAWELADKLLVVSVMLGTDEFVSQFKPYKDGIITSRNTFQKYYQQSEIKAYIERSLDEVPIAIAPGIFFIFKDKLAEQDYLQNRYRRHHNWQQRTSPTPITSQDKAQLVIAQNQALFDAFWQQSIDMGRVPAQDEFKDSAQLKSLIGSNNKVHQMLLSLYGKEEFEEAKLSRKEDLLLYFAMGLFEKRKPYTQQPDSLKRDIKALFDDYRTAINLATELLFAIADTKLIEEQCEKAHQLLPASILNQGHSLIFHKEFIESLPLLLRVYVGAAIQMYGELDDAVDLVKIHITSGKLTLTHYDDFEQSVPFLVERIKVKMADQDIDFFDYVDMSRRPPLLNKHLLLDGQHKQYEKQKSFDKRLSKILSTDDKVEVIMHRQAFEEQLLLAGKKIVGFKITSL